MDLSVVFLGTGEIGLPTLQSLAEACDRLGYDECQVSGYGPADALASMICLT